MDSHSSFSYSMVLCQKLCVKSVIQVSLSLILTTVHCLNWFILMHHNKPILELLLQAECNCSHPLLGEGVREGGPRPCDLVDGTESDLSCILK